MILYRFQGRCEKWGGCGMLYIDPVVDSSLTNLRKAANKYVNKVNKENLTYRLGIQKLTMHKISKEILIETMSSEDVDSLIEKQLWISKWENDFNPELRAKKND